MRRPVPDRTDHDHDHATDLEQHDAAAMPGGTMRNEPQHRPYDDLVNYDDALRDDYNPGTYNDVIVNNEYDLIHIDDDDHHDDPPDYVLVRRDDYDNLAAAVHEYVDNTYVNIDVIRAAVNLVDHHNDAAGDARHR
jgi:hypothetical protein